MDENTKLAQYYQRELQELFQNAAFSNSEKSTLGLLLDRIYTSSRSISTKKTEYEKLLADAKSKHQKTTSTPTVWPTSAKIVPKSTTLATNPAPVKKQPIVAPPRPILEAKDEKEEKQGDGKGIINQFSENCYFRSGFAILYRIYRTNPKLRQVIDGLNYEDPMRVQMHVLDILSDVDFARQMQQKHLYFFGFLMKYFRINGLDVINANNQIRYQIAQNEVKTLTMDDLYHIFCQFSSIAYGGQHDANEQVINPFLIELESQPFVESLRLMNDTEMVYFTDKRVLDERFLSDEMVARLNTVGYKNDREAPIRTYNSQRISTYQARVKLGDAFFHGKNYRQTDTQTLISDLQLGLLELTPPDLDYSRELGIRRDGQIRVMKWDRFNISDLNQALMLQIDRLIEENGHQAQKLDNSVKINNMINVSKINNRGQKEENLYVCSGIMVHSGGAQAGHYRSYVRHGNAWVSTDNPNANIPVNEDEYLNFEENIAKNVVYVLYQPIDIVMGGANRPTPLENTALFALPLFLPKLCLLVIFVLIILWILKESIEFLDKSQNYKSATLTIDQITAT